MIGFKFTLSNKKKAFMKLITSWDESSFETYKKLCDAETITVPSERIRSFIKILCVEGSENAELFDEKTLEAFDGLISWINNLESIIPATTSEITSLNIAEQPWEKLVACHQIIEKNKANINLCAPDIVKAYFPEFDTNCPFSVLYSSFLVITEKIYQFHEKFKSLGEADYKPEEIRAGVRDFAQFGFFGTLNALCKGDITRYEEMLKQPAGTVYNTLVLDKFRSEYQQRLNDQQKK